MVDLSKVKKYKKDIIGIVLLTVAMIFISLYELDFVKRDFNVYDVLEGDRFGICAAIQAIREEGLRAIFFIDRWGAPEVSSAICNPSVDLLTTISLWVIGWFTPSSAFTFYLYIVITFILCALCMYLFLRIININVWVSCMIGAIFSLAPFHFLRTSHTAFIGYYTIPLCMIILYDITDFDILKRPVSRLLLFFCALLVGLGNPYYFFFSLMLFTLSYIIIIVRIYDKKKSLKESIKAVLYKCRAFVVMCLSFFMCQIPRLIYLLALDTDYNAVARYPNEAERYGLKLIQMVLPSPYHNNKLLQNLAYKYNMSGVSVNENITSCLGLLSVIGLIILFWVLYKNFVIRKKEFELIDYLALCNLLLLLVGTVGGLGTIFNYVVTAQFRCYNRISIFISCLCLTGLAIIMDRFFMKNRTIGIAIVIITSSIGIYDQVPLTPLLLYDSQSSIYQAQIEKYFNKIESVLEKGAMVYQLPHMQFPENGNVNELYDATHFLGFLFTDTLRWSYGGIKGINTTAENLYIDEGISESFLKELVEMGFSGIYVDTKGYTDGGKEIKTFYENHGLKPIISEDGTLQFYDIRKLEIDPAAVYQEQINIPGYFFISDISSFCGINISHTECVVLAKELCTTPSHVSQEIYNWLVQYGIDNMSNTEYVELLYKRVLGRLIVTDEEIGLWNNILENNEQNRMDILNNFIISAEFQSVYNLNR